MEDWSESDLYTDFSSSESDYKSAESSDSESSDSDSDESVVNDIDRGQVQINDDSDIVTSPVPTNVADNIANKPKAQPNRKRRAGGVANPGNDGSGDADNPDWEVGENFRPKKMKFRGKEEVLTPSTVITPVDFFLVLFDEDLQADIVRFTNKRANKIKIALARTGLGRIFRKTWKDVTIEEFKKFLGLTILMGNIKFPSVKLYWSEDDAYHHPYFSQTMSRNRFEYILRCLCCYDVETFGEDAQNCHKGAKILNMVERCVANFKKYYSPPKFLSLDEALLLHKGNLKFKQFMPKKRSRFGLKFYELGTSRGYILDALLYTGKGTIVNKKKGKHADTVVMKLMKSRFNKGHALFMDNYYNSIPLAEKLAKKGVQVVGTLNPKRVGIPSAILGAKLKKGETIFARRRQSNILVQKWKDKRDLLMISARHNGDMMEVKKRKGKNQSNMKPSSVVEYNKHMGGIDRADQMTKYYSSPRKSIRWYLKVFFHCMDLCIWNANILYNLKTPGNKLNYLEFRNVLIREFFKKQSVLPSNRDRTSPNHFPCKVAKRVRCRVCSKNNMRSDTFFVCEACTDAKKQPIGLCVDKCFSLYHRSTQ